MTQLEPLSASALGKISSYTFKAENTFIIDELSKVEECVMTKIIDRMHRHHTKVEAEMLRRYIYGDFQTPRPDFVDADGNMYDYKTYKHRQPFDAKEYIDGTFTLVRDGPLDSAPSTRSGQQAQLPTPSGYRRTAQFIFIDEYPDFGAKTHHGKRPKR